MPGVDLTELRKVLKAIAKNGYTSTLRMPAGALERRQSLWRNVLINPMNNPRSMPLEERIERNTWHPNYGPPKFDTTLYDDVSTLLQALYKTLPLDRITKNFRSRRTNSCVLTERESAKRYRNRERNNTPRKRPISHSGRQQANPQQSPTAEPILSLYSATFAISVCCLLPPGERLFDHGRRIRLALRRVDAREIVDIHEQTERNHRPHPL